MTAAEAMAVLEEIRADEEKFFRRYHPGRIGESRQEFEAFMDRRMTALALALDALRGIPDAAALRRIIAGLEAPPECDCAAVDIGVGVMHEPGCGTTNPKEVAEAIRAALGGPPCK